MPSKLIWFLAAVAGGIFIGTLGYFLLDEGLRVIFIFLASLAWGSYCGTKF